MEKKFTQFVEAPVTEEKFRKEMETFHDLKQPYRENGVLLLEYQFPDAFFAFLATRLNPMPVAFAVRINFLNYDVEPLSVKFINPVTFQPIRIADLRVQFRRQLPNGETLPLVIAENDGEPFFCVPGIREYHQHPFHTGDSWYLYRKNNKEGTLCFILDNLHWYGTNGIIGYQPQMQIQLGQIHLAGNAQP